MIAICLWLTKVILTFDQTMQGEELTKKFLNLSTSCLGLITQLAAKRCDDIYLVILNLMVENLLRKFC